MKKLTPLLLLLVFACKSGTKNHSKEYEVTEASVTNTIKFLSSDDLKGRDTGSEGIDKAAKFLEDLFIKNSVSPYFTYYKDTLTNYDKPAFNVVGYLPGNDPKLKNEFVVFGAHYDHLGIAANPVANDSIYNGANDDASGTTAVTELVNYFATTKSNKRSILFCFFTAEEKGLLGSEHLAERLKQQNFNLYAMLNFEMIGVPMHRDIMSYITGYDMSNMAAKINEYGGDEHLTGKLATAQQYGLFSRSDNYSFYQEFHAPAQTICTFDFTNFAYYHKVQDDFSNVDTAHMTRFIKAMIPVADKMVNAPTDEIKLNN